jgi:acetylornithine deacetylase/succinyl-diaminopimelate desuccinylase-like protein
MKQECRNSSARLATIRWSVSGRVPTAEINGIGGGYQGQGTKTVIASHAMAKLTFRLVPDQEGDEILKLARAHLRKNLPKGVTMEITDGHSGPWYLTDPHSAIGEAAQRALREAFEPRPALIREGGSIPIVSQFAASSASKRC